MLGTELVVTTTLCFASADSYMSINSSYVEDNPDPKGRDFGAWPKYN